MRNLEESKENPLFCWALALAIKRAVKLLFLGFAGGVAEGSSVCKSQAIKL